jgi:hypothetical protein
MVSIVHNVFFLKGIKISCTVQNFQLCFLWSSFMSDITVMARWSRKNPTVQLFSDFDSNGSTLLE